MSIELNMVAIQLRWSFYFATGHMIDRPTGKCMYPDTGELTLETLVAISNQLLLLLICYTI